mgnify:CR=1 FL=1
MKTSVAKIASATLDRAAKDVFWASFVIRGIAVLGIVFKVRI